MAIIVIADVKGPREVKGYHATTNNHALTTVLLLVERVPPLSFLRLLHYANLAYAWCECTYLVCKIANKNFLTLN